jgi:hypothetical protein
MGEAMSTLLAGSLFLLSLGVTPGDGKNAPLPRKPTATSEAQHLEQMRQATQAAALQRLQLQRAHDAKMAEILALSHISAQGHEVNLMIINNMRPSGRYEYNPATGKYDRFVPVR